MSEMLPTSKEIAALLTQVTLAGQQSGVEFAIFKPGAPRQEDFYAVYPTQVRVEGAYHAVGRFMAEIANLSRIVNFVDLNFAAADEPTRDRTVVAGFTAEAYAFQDRPVATQPSAEEAKAGAKGAKSAKAKSASNSKASAKKPGEAK
jgi:type IV pilus assembly protein PilO